MKKILFYATIILAALSLAACQGDDENNNGHKKGNKGQQESKITIQDNETATEPSELRIFIDNSASMKGYTYLKNSNNFIAAISNLRNIANNNEAFFWGEKNAIDKDKLIPQVLDNYRFPGGDTPFPKIFGTMVKDIDTTGRLEFIITDGIISFKRDQQKYLESAIEQIKNQITAAINSSSDISVCVFRLTSGYSNGKNDNYYTKDNTTVKLKDVVRPFFVIAIGKRANIQWFLDKINTDQSLALYKNADLIAFGIHDHTTEIQFSNKSQFEVTGSCLKLKKKSGDFELMGNLPKCLLDEPGEQYLKDNVKLLVNDEPDNNFSVSINGETIRIKCNDIHRIRTASTKLTLTLKKEIDPKWITSFSSDDDTQIKDLVDQQNRTYALATLLQGIYEATDQNAMLINTEITIKK